MQRRNLGKLHRVIEELRKLRERSTESVGVADVMLRLLSEIDPTEDILPADFNDFCELQHQMPDVRVTNPADMAYDKDYVQRLKPIVERALAEPVLPDHSRFPTVKDGVLRSILERDLVDAEQCLRRQLWKPAIVLSGSILEAALYEYLLRNTAWTMDPQRKGAPKRKRSPKDITKTDLDNQWTLQELVHFACANDIIKKYREDTISDVLRTPRNLIHPMKEVREKGRVDEGAASVSLTMLKDLLAELAARPERV